MLSSSSFVQMIVEPIHVLGEKNKKIKFKVSDLSKLILMRKKEKVITIYKKGIHGTQ